MLFKKEADKFYERLEKKVAEGKFAKESNNLEIDYYRKVKINPIFNKDGTINKFNLFTGGSYKKLIIVLIFVIIAVGFIFEYHSNLESCSNLMNKENLQNNVSLFGFNLTESIINGTKPKIKTENG